MNYYFVVLISIWCISLGATLVEHGKPKTGTTNFFVTFVSFIIHVVLTYFAIKTGF